MPHIFRLQFALTFATILFLLTVSSLSAAAKEVDLFAPPEGCALAKSSPAGPDGLNLYSMTSNDARWYIAQWVTPGDFGPFVRSVGPGGGKIYTAQGPGGWIKVEQGAEGYSYTLTQSGASLACTGGGKPLEYDLLISTNGRSVTPHMPAAALIPPDSAPLSHMRSLTQIVNVRVIRAGPAAMNKHCDVNQGGAFFAVVLRNSTRKQTLFYKMSISTLCGPGPNQAECRKRSGIAYFYFRKNPFGYVDFISAHGQAMLTAGHKGTIKFDMLPRLTSLIRSGDNGIDQDLAHWVVDGAYFGSHVFGNVLYQTHWSGYHLIADLP